MSGPLLIVLSILGGCCIALQGPINGVLARGVGSPITAALISFAAGLAALGLVFVAVVGPGGVSPGWRTVPTWIFAIGGVLGAVYITVTALAVQRLGAATYLALVIAGQIGTGLLLDHLGAFGLVRQDLSPGRLAAAGLIVAGVVLTRLT